MPEYYLDFETQGLDPENHKIITIQYQPLDTVTGEATGNLTILKEWETLEKDIIDRFLSVMNIQDLFSFIPIGFNLRFEFRFLLRRAKKISDIDLDLKWLYYELPHVDIKHTFVMMNRGRIKGTTLDWFVKKQKDQTKVPLWYTNKEYKAIEEYIRDEAKRFIHGYKFLKTELPMIHQKYDPLP